MKLLRNVAKTDRSPLGCFFVEPVEKAYFVPEKYPLLTLY